MPYYFVNIADPDQEISPDIRSHVMRNFVQRKKSKINYERSLVLTAKQNQTQSRIAKLRPQKTIVSEVNPDPELRSRSGTFEIRISRHDTLHSTTIANAPTATATTIPRINQYDCHNTHGLAIPYLATGAIEGKVAQLQDERGQLMLVFNGAPPQKCIGCEIDPFHTLPQLPNSGLNIERLKKYCKLENSVYVNLLRI